MSTNVARGDWLKTCGRIIPGGIYIPPDNIPALPYPSVTLRKVTGLRKVTDFGRESARLYTSL